MFLNAKAFFDDHTAGNTMLLIRAETDIPNEFIRLYKKNVVSITPMKTGALRRSIITLVSAGKAEISWRSAYAGAQNQGFHAGSGPYVNYTTSGTGANFAGIAFQRTQAEMPAVLRQLGLTQ